MRVSQDRGARIEEADGTLERARNTRQTISQATIDEFPHDYDDRNQLTQVKHYDATKALVMMEDSNYEYFGLRIEKSVSDGVTNQNTHHALNGWNPAKLPSSPGSGVGGEGPVGTEGYNVWAKLDGSSSLEAWSFYNDDIDHLLARIDHVDTTAVQLRYLLDNQNSTHPRRVH